MAFASVHDNNIHYEIIGDKRLMKEGPSLVFLHEGLGSIAQWKDFPDSISRITGLPALVYDRYGYGLSEKLKEKRNGQFMLEAAQDELPALLDELGIEGPLGLIGHSDGATVALFHASLFPERVKAVVSEAAHVMLEDVSRSGIRNTIKQFEETRFREFLERYHGDRTESMFYGWAHTWISKEMDGWDMKAYLQKIQAPVMAIQGEGDEYGSPEQLRWIEQYSGGLTELYLVPDCGHNPHFQQREAVTEKITGFITKHLIS